MIRTQIQLTDDQHAWLKRVAREENISMAELIRRAIDYLESRRNVLSDRELRERAKDAAGRFSADVDDLAANHDKYFAESIEP